MSNSRSRASRPFGSVWNAMRTASTSSSQQVNVDDAALMRQGRYLRAASMYAVRISTSRPIVTVCRRPVVIQSARDWEDDQDPASVCTTITPSVA